MFLNGPIQRQHPDVLERREQLRHVLGVPSFSIMSSDSLSRTEIPESIEEDVIIRLIDQYLREFGFDRASAVLRQETGAFVASNPASAFTISYQCLQTVFLRVFF